jgi:hypothetical protein
MKARRPPQAGKGLTMLGFWIWSLGFFLCCNLRPWLPLNLPTYRKILPITQKTLFTV